MTSLQYPIGLYEPVETKRKHSLKHGLISWLQSPKSMKR